MSVVKSVVNSNQNRKKILINKVFKILGSKIKNKKIAFLGVTFKPNTDDMRDSTSLSMIPFLSQKGACISYYDPTGRKEELSKFKNCTFKKNIKENCKNADLIILHTEWDEFKAIDFKKINKKRNFKIYDLRNLFNLSEMKLKKIKYYSIGRPNIN